MLNCPQWVSERVKQLDTIGYCVGCALFINKPCKKLRFASRDRDLKYSTWAPDEQATTLTRMKLFGISKKVTQM